MDLHSRRSREYHVRVNFSLWDSEFKERFRFSCAEVEEILTDIGVYLKNDKEFYYGLEPHHRFLLALRYYASGDFCYSVGDSHGISKTAVHASVSRVTVILNEVYFEEVVAWPADEEARKLIAGQFCATHRFPGVCGVIDGTLIEILAPSDNENQFVDRKGKHSLNVMAIAGPDYQFLGINANWPGAVHDARVLRESKIYQRFNEGWRPIPNGVLIGDSAYPL